MSKYDSRFTILAPVAVVLAGCGFDLSVPKGTQITCSSQAECPPDFTCRTAIGLCVPVDAEAATPTIAEGSLHLAPSLVGRGGELRLDFTVSTAVALAPDVTLKWGGAAPLSRAMVLDEATTDELQFSFVYAAQGDEPALPATVVIGITDANGIRGGSDLKDAVVFDFVDPKVTSSSLLLTPDANNPLVQIEALRTGSSARLRLYTDEPLGHDPEVRAACSGGDLSFTRTPGETSTTFFSSSVTLGSEETIEDGICPLLATLTDLAGNELRDLDLGLTLVIDRTAPSALLEVDGSAVKQLRVPWGALQTAGVPGQFLVRADLAASVPPLDDCAARNTCIPAAAFNSGAERVLQARVFDSRGQLLAIMPRRDTLAGAADGWTPAQLPGDASSVYVRVVDAAGNLSADAVIVPLVEWVATMGGKQAGSTATNPHLFNARPYFLGSLAQVNDQEWDGAKQLDTLGTPEASSGTGTWQQLDADKGPSARYRIGAAYDSVRGRVVILGGENGGGMTPELVVWEWDGAHWRSIAPTDPEHDGNPGSFGTLLAFDPGLRKVVHIYEGKMWAWDGTSWERLCDGKPAADTCEVPGVSGLAYDTNRGVLLASGGWSGGTMLDQLWEWDGRDWTQVCGQGTTCSGPGGRSEYSLAYDRKRKQLLLFGGYASASMQNDTWGFDGSQWTRLCADAAACAPPTSVGAAMAYDAIREQVVLFDGSTDTNDRVDGMWAWNGTAWEAITPADDYQHGRPSARYMSAMVFDEAHRELVTFGGVAGDTSVDCTSAPIHPCGGTWAFDGSSWVRRTNTTDPRETPSVRFGHAMAYDPPRARTVLVGGNNDGTMLGDTWSWDGAAWRRECSSCADGADTLAGRTGHALAYDAAASRQEIVLFGGGNGSTQFNDTWTWNGAWSLASSSGPPRRRGAALAYAGEAEAVLLLGGITTDATQITDEVWAWSGSAWSAAPVAGGSTGLSAPWVRYERGAVALSDGGVLVFGGQDNSATRFNDTWLRDGTTGLWSLVCGGDTTCAAPSKTEHAMAFDAARGQVVVFGGDGDTEPDATATWLWNGRTWTRVEPDDPEGDGNPTGRVLAAMAYDEAAQRPVLFGGSGPPSFQDTWAWNGGAERAPGHVFHVRFGAALMPAAAVVQRLEAQWYAGASSAESGSSTSTLGARLLLWDGGAWREVAHHTGDPSAPRAVVGTDNPWLLAWSSAEDAQLAAVDAATLVRRLLTGSSASLALAATPLHVNGRAADPAIVATDYVEARVVYALTSP